VLVKLARDHVEIEQKIKAVGFHIPYSTYAYLLVTHLLMWNNLNRTCRSDREALNVLL
jgi:hypothetical protein